MTAAAQYRPLTRRTARTTVALLAAVLAALGLVVAASPAIASPAVATSPAVAAAPTFTGGRVTPPDSALHDGEFTDVSCPASDYCMAVGDAQLLDGTRGTIAQKFTGQSWSGTGYQPLYAAARSAALTSVSCASRFYCLAVGTYTDAAGAIFGVAETWDGSRWRSVGTSGPGTAAFVSVWCAARDDCFMAGAGPRGDVVWRWNGRGWTLLGTPRPGDSSTLSDITCVSGSNCVAVGSYRTKKVSMPLIIAWNGRGWSSQASPLPDHTGGQLSAVSCPTPGSCTAVGTFLQAGQRSPLVENRQAGSGYHYDTRQSADYPKATFSALDCSGPYRCTATGTYAPSGTGSAPFVASRTSDAGFSYSAVTEPSLHGKYLAVACPGGTCELVGHFSSASGDLTVAVAGNGTTLSQQPTSTPATTDGGSFTAVSCAPGSSFCAATADGPDDKTAVEIHRGTGDWFVSPASRTNGEFHGVSCPSTTFCMAVGDPGDDDGIAYRWDGTTWTPTSPTQSGTLFAVSCASASFCVAVGGSEGNSQVVEVWDGTSWANVPGAATGQLRGVSCPSATYCAIVGSTGGAPILETYDGSALHTVAAPAPSGQPTFFSGFPAVSCSDDTDCVATGQPRDPSRPNSFEIVLSGGSWRAVPAASGSPSPLVLHGVSCSRPRSCFAVGNGASVPRRPAGQPTFLGGRRTVVEHWDGSRWSLVTDQAPTGAATTLNAVSCAPDCTAVGVSSAVIGVPFAESNG